VRTHYPLGAMLTLIVVTGVLRAADDPETSLPTGLTSAAILRPALEKMRQSSSAFRRQCRRLASVPSLRVSLALEDPSRRPSHRARSAMTYRDGRLVSVDIRFTLLDDPVELIAHELEHVIEQLDGIDLEIHARTGMAWKREDGAFETRRATEVGKRVAREVHLPSTTLASPTLPPDPPWRPMHVVAQQQAFASAHDPPSGRVSADGRFVVLASEARLVPWDENSTSDIYVLDVAAGLVTLETHGVVAGSANGSSVHPDISGDGRYMVFESTAGNLTPVELAAGIPRVFWRDRSTGVTRLLSATTAGAPADGVSRGPAISADGSVVVFTSSSTNVLDDVRATGGMGVYRIDLASNVRSRIDVTPDGRRPAGQGASPSISGDGRLVAFTSNADLTTGTVRGDRPRDANGVYDVYVRDVLEARTTRVSIGPSGSDSDGPSYHPAISLDGRHLVFVSEASHLTSNRRQSPAQVFVRDLKTGTIEMVSHTPAGRPGNAPSSRPAVSGDGAVIAYQSLASNLLCETRCDAADLDINLLWDVYVHDRRARHTTRVSRSQTDEWMDSSRGPSMDAAGRALAFASTQASSPDDRGHDEDLFIVGMNRR
jgi:Tol biopolymer transport system component